MSFADRKVLQVLREETARVPERCPDYRAEVFGLLSEVLLIERAHQVTRTNVVGKIADKVSATGRWFHERSKSGSET